MKACEMLYWGDTYRPWCFMLIYLSLLVALIGALMYVLASNPKFQELGRLSFAVGLLSFLLKASEPMLHLP